MTIYYLPARTDLEYYDYQTDLEGNLYTLEFYWNSRSGYWFLSVYDVDGNPIVSGRKVVLGAPLLGRAERVAGPPGVLMAFDTSGTDEEAGVADLGARVQLIYFESTEMG